MSHRASPSAEPSGAAFASNLGAVPISTVPVGVIVALGAGVLVVANLLAIGPALVAARSRTVGQLLRTQ